MCIYEKLYMPSNLYITVFVLHVSTQLGPADKSSSHQCMHSLIMISYYIHIHFGYPIKFYGLFNAYRTLEFIEWHKLRCEYNIKTHTHIKIIMIKLIIHFYFVFTLECIYISHSSRTNCLCFFHSKRPDDFRVTKNLLD